MGKWQYFLNSLATVGGNLALLMAIMFIMLGLVVHILHGDGKDNAQVTPVILSTFSGFSGALLGLLRGRVSDTNPLPGGGTTSTTTITENKATNDGSK